MTASELVAELRGKDVRLSVAGPDRLHVNAPERVVTPELVDALRQHKADIIAELRRRDAEARAFFRKLGRDPDAWREFEIQMERRADALQSDGGIARDQALAQAEILTYEDWLN